MTPRLSQNIAGVTIMALGNGAPDIFSALAGIGQGRPELVFAINLSFTTMIIITTVLTISVRLIIELLNLIKSKKYNMRVDRK